MPAINDLNLTLSALQHSGLNSGGSWEARLFDKSDPSNDARSVLICEFKKRPAFDDFEKHKEFAEKGGWNPEDDKLTKNLELIELTDWENQFDSRIEHWSNFELIAWEEMSKKFNRTVYLENKHAFLTALHQFLASETLLHVSKINEEKFDTYAIWREQICEDIVFELKDKVLVISFGWSS